MYQSYEILTMFAAYSMAGYLLTCCYLAVFPDERVRRGVAKGPFCIAYGIGALLVIYCAQWMGDNPVKLFFLGAAAGALIEILTGTVTGILSGKGGAFFHWYHPAIFGLLSVLLVLHWNKLLIGILRYISPWFNMLALIIVYIGLTLGIIDGIFALPEERGHEKRQE